MGQRLAINPGGQVFENFEDPDLKPDAEAERGRAGDQVRRREEEPPTATTYR